MKRLADEPMTQLPGPGTPGGTTNAGGDDEGVGQLDDDLRWSDAGHLLTFATLGASWWLVLLTMGGLLLAFVDAYTSVAAVVIATLLWVGSCRWLLRAIPLVSDRWSSVVVLVVVVGAISSWSANHAAQHVETYRDPGSYLTTATWLNREHGLQANVNDRRFDGLPDVSYGGPALYEVAPGHLEFQFSHGASIPLAAAETALGPRGLFTTTVAIGALVLLLLHLVARRMGASPPIAIAMVGAIGISVPFLYVTRTTYSEPYLMVALWSAVLVLMHRRPATSTLLVGGAFVGGCTLFRIDGQMYLIAALLVAAVFVVAHSNRTAGWAVPLGAVVPFVIGSFDVWRFSGAYIDDLASQTRRLDLGTVAAFSLVVVVVVSARARTTLGGLLRRTPAWLANVLAGAIGLAMLALWLVRPHVQTARGNWPESSGSARSITTIQERTGLPLDGTRSYAELSVSQIGWYFGVVTLALAIAGLVRIVARGIRRPTEPEGVLTTFFVVAAPLYLVSPNISPDHPWTTRRYISFVYPVLLVCAATLATVLLRRVRGWDHGGRRVAVVATVATVALLTAPVAAATWPLRDHSEQRGFYPALRSLCDQLPGDAAVLGLQQHTASMMLRTWCGVAAASVSGSTAREAVMQFLVDDPSTCDDRFVLVTPDAEESVIAWVPAAEVVARVDFRAPITEFTLDRRPSSIDEQYLPVSLMRSGAACVG